MPQGFHKTTLRTCLFKTAWRKSPPAKKCFKAGRARQAEADVCEAMHKGCFVGRPADANGRRAAPEGDAAGLKALPTSHVGNCAKHEEIHGNGQANQKHKNSQDNKQCFAGGALFLILYWYVFVGVKLRKKADDAGNRPRNDNNNH